MGGPIYDRDWIKTRVVIIIDQSMYKQLSKIEYLRLQSEEECNDQELIL